LLVQYNVILTRESLLDIQAIAKFTYHLGNYCFVIRDSSNQFHINWDIQLVDL